MKHVKVALKASIIYAICTIIIVFFSIIAFICYTKYRKEFVLKEVIYYSTDSSSYEVYYSNSNIVGGKTTEEGFIRKYTDHIDIDYNYMLYFSDMIDGVQESLVKATLIIYAPGSEVAIWKSDPEYLVPSKKLEYENTNVYKFNNKVSIDYKKYLNLYEQFKNETSIVSNAKISVEFVNGSIAQPEDVPKIIQVDTITYDIPVSDVTFTIDKKSNITGKDKSSKTIVHDEDKKVFIYLIALCVIIIAGMASIIVYIYIKERKKNGNYKNTLDKILKSYDNIIVNIATIPSLKNKEIINVTSFEELLDAQMEIRVPINYCETVKDKESKFIIVTNDMAWVYVLRKEGR